MLEDSDSSPRRTLDPILTLQVAKAQVQAAALGSPSNLSTITSLCFLNSPKKVKCTARDEEDSSDDDGDLELQCSNMLKGERHDDADVTAEAREKAAFVSLQGSFLATCHANGESLVWDLARRKVVQEFVENRGPGLALRRIEGSSGQILYQTRDSSGTVSLHDVTFADRIKIRSVVHLQTGSQTFCAAAPCMGDRNLVALPSEDDTHVTVRDWRMPSTHRPILSMHAAGLSSNHLRKCGMLTSLGLCATNGRRILACGMENGELYFHDLAMPKSSNSEAKAAPPLSDSCSIQLSKDPVLSLDLAASAVPKNTNATDTVLAIAGMAGDAAELCEVPESDRGTVAIIKTTVRDDRLQVRLRTRLATCEIGGRTAGKPGVDVCRFRPDSRIFAVGGWDHRLRIFDRSSNASALAILKGHTASVNAVDWAPDASTSGLLATGASDGRVNIWRCFST